MFLHGKIFINVKFKKTKYSNSYFLDALFRSNDSVSYKNIIISTANSNTMNGVVKISDIVKDKSSLNVEGKTPWLLSEIKVLIHIFNNESRKFYELEIYILIVN